MNTITKYVVLLILCLSATQLQAQEVIKDSTETRNYYKINSLKELKKKIKKEEREFLKIEIESVNERLDNGELTQAEADKLKKELAKKRALNIENRLAIIDNKIALLERNDEDYKEDNVEVTQIGISLGNFTGLTIRSKDKPRKYDRRTTSDLVWAFGLNNTIIDGQSLEDSPYKIATSGFMELGWAWKTRILKESNFWRLKYGFSFQWNKLKPKDNQYFVQDGDVTTLEEFPVDLKKSKFRVTNLVFPVHLEFGPSKKIERKSYFRYSTRRKFKIGLGGYAGIRLGTLQKLKYVEDGDRQKQKNKQNFNASNFIYGLSGYVGVGNTSLYLKYDLNPLFRNQSVDQNNVSLGIRFDFD